MDNREFIRRKSGGPVRRPSRRNGPPRILWVLLALAVIAAIFILIFFFRKNPGNGEEEGTGSEIGRAHV